MAPATPLFSSFNRFRPIAALFLRLAFGFHLLYFTQDNVFSYDRMLEFRDFLAVRHVPMPLVAAFVSVAVQFTCGLLLIIGWQVRLAGLLIVVNFIMAFVIAHVGQTYEQFFQPVQLIAVGLFFLLHGAGSLSVDQYLARRRDTKKAPLPVNQPVSPTV